jgi:hypothetical protein
MKITVKILAIWGCIATISFFYLLCVYLDREGIVQFRSHGSGDSYYYANLRTMKLPTWNLTNAIPLSPDAAVKVAMHYASEKHPAITTWNVYQISIERWENEPIWFYDIVLADQSRRDQLEAINVLMDGTIWKPTEKKR